MKNMLKWLMLLIHRGPKVRLSYDIAEWMALNAPDNPLDFRCLYGHVHSIDMFYQDSGASIDEIYSAIVNDIVLTWEARPIWKAVEKLDKACSRSVRRPWWFSELRTM